MHLRNGILYRLGDVLLGDLGSCPGASISTIQVDNVGAGIIAANCDHLDIVRGRDLHREQRLRVHSVDPVQVLLVILDRVDAVERER